MRNFYISITLIILVSSAKLLATDQRFGMNEHLGDKLPPQLELRGEDSSLISLGELVTKPTLLSFVYYRCPGLCSPMMEGIAEAIEYTNSKLGKDYQVITISIDYKETPGLAAKKKANYLKQIDNKAAKGNWKFFTADSIVIHELTSRTGWEFKRQGNDFVHPAATMMITPKGMISQYFYGTYFNYMHLEMAIEDAKKEIVNPVRLKKMKYCYNYDPPKNQITNLVTKSFGILVIILALTLFTWLVVIPFFKARIKHIKN